MRMAVEFANPACGKGKGNNHQRRAVGQHLARGMGIELDDRECCGIAVS
jgi:hypothetical protein